MKIESVLFEKVGEGRGRPSKFFILDDGSKVHWKDFAIQHPDIVHEFNGKCLEQDQAARKKKQEVSQIVREEPKGEIKEEVEIKQTKTKTVEVEGTIATKTINGTPVNIINCIGKPEEGVDLVCVIVNAKSGREYITSVSSRDLVKPDCELPAEFHGLKFAGEA